LAQKNFLSLEKRAALRKVVRHIKEHYRITNDDLATGAHINVHAVRSFLSNRGAGPRGETVAKLLNYIMEKFLSTEEALAGLADDVRLLMAHYSRNTSPWHGDLRAIFPEILEDFIYRVPKKFFGTYVIYRRAAVGGDVVRSSLIVREGAPGPTFVNAYRDSVHRKRTTKGFVFCAGTVLQLLGHIAPFSTLKLTTFDWPDRCNGELLSGLTISNDFRNRFFASRCVANKIPAESHDEAEMGVFTSEEVNGRPWRDEFQKIEPLLENTVTHHSVLFLPMLNGISEPG
jgi:hypothetical protein